MCIGILFSKYFYFFSTKMGEFVVSAGTAEKRMYWLQQLQKARREFSAGGASAVRHSVMPHQVIIYVITL